jgi:plasmid stability protein
MAQLVVRNLEQSVKARLQRRAKRNGHSMEEEVREILRNALKSGEVGEEVGLGTRIQRRFAGIGFREGEIPELRGQQARPAIFKK